MNSIAMQKYPGLGELGELGQVAAQAVTSLSQATTNVNAATALVSKLSNDVKLGMAPRSDLVTAMDDLLNKVNVVKNLSAKGKALSGYLGQTMGSDWSVYLIILVISMGVCYFCCRKSSPKLRKSKK